MTCIEMICTMGEKISLKQARDESILGLYNLFRSIAEKKDKEDYTTSAAKCFASPM